MSKATILVTGASGQQGGAVARSLVSQGQSIRALSRSPERLNDLKAQGAEVIAGDLNDRASLEAALAGIKRAFLVTTPFETGTDAETQQGITFVDAAQHAGVEHLVYTSVAGADEHTGIPHFESKWKIEQHIQAVGIPATILRPVFFMENFGSPWFLPSIQGGTFSLPVDPDRPTQMIALGVIGAFGAAALIRPSEFIGKTIQLASDELTFVEAMKLLSEAAGKTIRYERLPDEQAEGALGHDLAKMFRWFNAEGFSVNLAELKPYDIPLTTFKDHVASAAWVNQVRGVQPIGTRTP